jgi:hypothetical protein
MSLADIMGMLTRVLALMRRRVRIVRGAVLLFKDVERSTEDRREGERMELGDGS